MTAPILQIRNKNGGSWTVHAELPHGSFEEISGFATENDANEWIAKELTGSIGVSNLTSDLIRRASLIARAR